MWQIVCHNSLEKHYILDLKKIETKAMNNYLNVENLIKAEEIQKIFFQKEFLRKIFQKYLKWGYGLQIIE